MTDSFYITNSFPSCMKLIAEGIIQTMMSDSVFDYAVSVFRKKSLEKKCIDACYSISSLS